MFKKLKEKKGFTLVELIVVLVILAILAALLIPALTGYIDKAREKSVIAETRQAVMATQTLADETYASKETGSTLLASDIDTDKILKLAELTGKGTISNVTFTKGKLATLTYTQDSSNGGRVCDYADGKYTVQDK